MTAETPMHPDTRLTRKAAAEALTKAGFPTTAASLATLAVRGGGPAYTLYNNRVLHRWADLIEWAEARQKPPKAAAARIEHARA